MSLDIDQIALHQLIKRDENQLELALRDSLLPAISSSKLISKGDILPEQRTFYRNFI
ncbi:hypothetical protein GKC49_30715, partial [Pantoea agglomerans]|nr:hypothetical protein [Pantoea agglomerans]